MSRSFAGVASFDRRKREDRRSAIATGLTLGAESLAREGTPAPCSQRSSQGGSRVGTARWKVIFSGVAAIAILVASHSAYACGAAYPGGPVMCDIPQRDSDRILRVDASYAFTSTTLDFGTRSADLTRHSVFASLQLPLNGSGSLTGLAGVGLIAGGDLMHGAARDTIQPGVAADIGIAYRVYDGNRYVPFVQLTLTLSFAHMETETDAAGARTDGTVSPTGQSSSAFNAFDARGGVIVGKTFAHVFTPYITGRVFGGPVYWTFDGDNVMGHDAYQYQLGGGLSLAVFKGRLDVFAEGIGFGEKGIAAGIGTTFF
jgi:hypothetical protein